MRISPAQQASLKQQFADVLGDDCELWLFGSRVDDNARGGDVDLLARSPRPIERSVWTACLLAARAERLFEGRKVDVLLLDPLTRTQPIHIEALAKGVRL